ncbi:hypothetical protein HUG15_21280 [Salicibibacter cibarius]|uniref:Amphi-Trp domain-containing protein n=1 Tax=Salicibibacter cibarius TaxID=2743000 RepID=A0A7T6Z6M7_9BACI|nr:hypothetical protein [Salicibibacter cibarius]QQK77859.1 hypothetical protein HUG15_21280 [Salicibibacter cibarius]
MFGQERLEQTELYAREQELAANEAAAELERLAEALRTTGSFDFLQDDRTYVQAHIPSHITVNSEYLQKKQTHTVRLTFSWLEQQ